MIYHLHYISDLHLEFYKDTVDFLSIPTYKRMIYCVEDDPINILVIAGDLGHADRKNYRRFLSDAKTIFDEVVYVKGNHEYYSKHVSQKNRGKIDSVIQKICDELGVIYLNNKSWIYELEEGKKVKFIGTTLWSHIDELSFVCMNDKNFCYATVEQANKLHKRCVLFLEEELKKDPNIPTIIVTHHLPSRKCIHPKYDDYYIAHSGYFTDLEYLVKNPVKLWIYGHTHTGMQLEINGISVQSNPSGYPDEQDERIENRYEPVILNNYFPGIKCVEEHTD